MNSLTKFLSLSLLFLVGCSKVPNELADYRIVYNTQVDSTNWEVFMMEIDGSNPTNLSNTSHYEWAYPASFSTIYLTNNVLNIAEDRLYRLSLNSGEQKMICELNVWGGISREFQGKILASGMRGSGVSTLNQLFFINLPQGDYTQVTKNFGIDFYQPAFSPDGKSVVFLRMKADPGPWHAPSYGDDLWIMDLDDQSLKPLTKYTDTDSVGYRPKFKPRSPYWAKTNKIYYVLHKDSSLAFYSTGKIYSSTLDGKIEQITPSNINVESFSFSPDEKWIVFDNHMGDESTSQIFLLRLEGLEITQVTNDKQLKIGPFFIETPK